MYARLFVLAMALALCHAFPQHHATSYSSFARSSYGGHQSAGYGGHQSAGYGGRLSAGHGFNYFGGYGHHAYVAPVVTKVAAVAPVVTKVAVAPIAKVVTPVLAIGKQVAHHIDYYADPKYNFEYAVEDKHTGDIKSQHEERDGDNTRGYYTVHEPDGTVLTVHYTVDKHSGFQAVVERKGHAVHPQVVKKVALVAPVHHHAYY